MITVRRREFRRWAGCLIYGKNKLQIPTETNHLDRAGILTSLVESGGRLGTVMSYDGTGITAGLIQCIGVLPAAVEAFGSSKPASTQGPLWQLVEKVTEVYPSLTSRLIEEFNDSLGWDIKNGVVIDTSSGTPVHGRDLRHELTPPHGVVPKFGENWDSAKGWALIFHEIFSDPRTSNIQILEARKHFSGLKTRAWGPLHGHTLNSLLYRKLDKPLYRGDPLDLAMGIFYSYSVNSPSKALQIFWEAFKETINTRKIYHSEMSRILATNLVEGFRKSTYGNWPKRHKRTRAAAKKIWPTELFSEPYPVMS